MILKSRAIPIRRPSHAHPRGSHKGKVFYLFIRQMKK